MNSDPGTRKDRDKTTPNNVPNCPAMREIRAVVSRQRAVINGLDGVPVNRGSMNQVVDKNEKQHSVKRGRASDGRMRRFLSESSLKRSCCVYAKYTWLTSRS